MAIFLLRFMSGSGGDQIAAMIVVPAMSRGSPEDGDPDGLDEGGSRLDSLLTTSIARSKLTQVHAAGSPR
jgi:hypothetical protein